MRRKAVLGTRVNVYYLEKLDLTQVGYMQHRVFKP